MPELKFSCPQCGQRIQCDTGYAGAQINCPGCQQPITVPQPPAAGPPPISSALRLGEAVPMAQRPMGAPLPARQAHLEPSANKKAIKGKTAIAIGIAMVVAIGITAIVVKERTSSNHGNIANDQASHADAAKQLTAPNPGHLPAGALPTTLEELNAWYVEPPTGQNAAMFILQGVKAMQTTGAKQNINVPDPSMPLPSAMKSALADFLQRNQEALQFFAQAAQFEQSRYPADLTKGSDTSLPHLQGVKKAGQLCEMAAMLDAENGHGKKAGDDVAMTLALARSLKAEPVLISQVVRVADISLAVTALNQSLNRTALPPESLSALAKMFREMEEYDASGEGFNRALVGEKVAHLALLNNREQLLRLDAKSQRLIEYVNKDANLRAEQNHTESAFQEIMASRQDAFPDRLKSFGDALEKGASEARNQGHLIDAMEWAGFEHLAVNEARNVANLRLAMTAIALEQFRAAHDNRYPDSLSGLVPACLDAVLSDPFDGKPLGYRKQGAGYVLSCAGPNLKDDGGKGMKTKDLVFAVVKPHAN